MTKYNVLLISLFLFPCLGERAVVAADKEIGKLFIKAGDSIVNGQQFSDRDLTDTVKDMKAKHGKFTIVEDESQADFLIVVLERKIEIRGIAGDPNTRRIIYATMSVKAGSTWKPACKISNGSGSGFATGGSWAGAAGHVINEAEKCALHQ